MDPPSSLPKPSSTLPRPLSKLPTFRPVSTISPIDANTARPFTPEDKPTPRQPPVRQSVLIPPSSFRQPTTFSARPSSIYSPLKGATQSPTRRPLQPSSRPQSRHDSANSSLSSINSDAAQDLRMRAKGQRSPSQQENTFDLMASPGGSEASSDGTGSTNTSPISTIRRGSRPSLSDRTMESISGIPPSPGVNRRRSSFFNPQSPMATPSKPASRPPSALANSTLPKPDFGTGRISNGFARPASPVRRPESSGSAISPVRSTMPVPQRRSVSSSLPKPGSVSGIALPPPKRVSNTLPSPVAHKAPGTFGARTVPRPAGASQAPGARGRPMSMIAPPQARTVDNTTPRPAVKSANTSAKLTRPGPGLTKPTKPTAPATTTVTASEISPDATTPDRSAKSSLEFRAQIAKAKAAARAEAQKKATPDIENGGYNFENVSDPFNQGASEATPLEKKIEAARRDGRLNIAALSLKSFPLEVMRMYDAEAMETSSVTWSETVDLVRLNAADNAFVQISDTIFPDASAEELAASADAKGNQFGGLEALDLHGNMLKSIPMGIRRLDMLTTLNLIPSLRELILSDNELAGAVPDSVSALTNLQTLNLSSNKLSSLPGSVRDLVNLIVLNLSSNRFDSLPIGSLFSLPTLKEIYVASNALTGAFFPMTVDIVRSLTHLDISNNSLVSLSFGVELHLPAIQTLNISRNRIFGLPNVSSWNSLLVLLAEENGLTALPDGFTNLKKIKTADFTRNNLRAIEAEVGRMTSLETLGIQANPLREKRLLGMSTSGMKEELMKKLDKE